jgi:betaine reductase
VITKEIERAGIPIVQVTNLTKIAEGIGSNRIFRGNSVLHVFGNPSLPKSNEITYRKGLVSKVLDMLTKMPPEGQSSLIWE